MFRKYSNEAPKTTPRLTGYLARLRSCTGVPNNNYEKINPDQLQTTTVNMVVFFIMLCIMCGSPTRTSTEPHISRTQTAKKTLRGFGGSAGKTKALITVTCVGGEKKPIRTQH